MDATYRERLTIGLRVMVWADLRHVLRIEADSFGHPWSEANFLEHLENPNAVALVLERSGLVVGYEVFGIDHPRIRFYSCVVRPAFRRRGVGSSMVAHVVRLTADRASGVLTKVPEKNVRAQLFFRQCRFWAVRVLPACLLNDEDVYVMEFSPLEWTFPAFGSGAPLDELIPL